MTNSAVTGLLTSSSAGTLAACINSCPANACCWAQWEAATTTCRRATLTAVGADVPGPRLHTKLSPSAMSSAASANRTRRYGDGGIAKANMLSSGIYSRCLIPAAQKAAWLAVGSTLDPSDAQTFSRASVNASWETVATPEDCERKCDNSNVCWGFVLDNNEAVPSAFNIFTGRWEAVGNPRPTNGWRCLYRGGIDALRTRSFFVVPTGVDLSQLNWQGATPKELATANALQVAAGQGRTLCRDEIEEVLDDWIGQGLIWTLIQLLQRFGMP